ncbi:pyridoxine/pyridoxamine 5'-phosphate oxidase [Arthrobacter sp. H14]|uniref:pyridoxine/pyridoxamine 5'-phosphate oxidase n=1 Tax=Arthrobacter sp. H14 TaxID=1312959 RepID=UPI00047BCFC6|nr:pyridoxal 5'-phosphate synthase [Arthrobacter sp. H14]
MRDSGRLRQLLREVQVFPEQMSGFDPDQTPDQPVELFLQWLAAAVDAGVLAPHAVNVATMGADGMPDARIVILKDISDGCWCFASSSTSPKGQQLQAAPSVALTFFWPSVGRQIRIRGRVHVGSPVENDQDFKRRNLVAKALVLAGQQSDVMQRTDDLDDAVAGARAQFDVDPETGSPSWTVYKVTAQTVEFWQADPDRRHIRLRYSRNDGHSAWRKDLLWP